MKMKNRSLSGREYEIISELASRKISIISIDELSKISKIKKTKLWDIVYRLEKKGWLERIEKGKYMLVPLQAKEGWLEHPFILVSNLVKKYYYISYRTALSHYGLTEQLPTCVYIVTTERKGKSERRLQNYIFKFVKIKDNKFFGFKAESIGSKKIFIADIEKAIVDSLDKERYAGSMIEIAQALSRKTNTKKIKRYALKMGNFSLNRRLGYLLDLLKKDSSGLEKHIGAHRNIYLSTLLPQKTLEISKKWRLVVNVKKEDLLK